MNPLSWSLCLWLWFMCTGVECLLKLHLSSRDQYDGGTTITIQFYVDESVKASEEDVSNFLRTVILQATNDLRNHDYFDVKDINLEYRIKHHVDAALEDISQRYTNERYMDLDGIIDALTNHFNTYNKYGNPDINCLVTNHTINNGDDILKAYGFSRDKTLCKHSVSMLLAYAPYAAYDAGRKFTEQIRDSLDPNDVKYYEQDKIKVYLSQCNGSFGPEDPDVKPPEPPTPPVNPPESPDTPVPIPTADTPEVPPPPGPPPPPPPEVPHESSSTEPVTTTTTTETPDADYC
uniref:Putative secreted protein n=1 Tax=Ixodes ricinus TaxID=34613 RepID=A0A0K8R6T2_IXORI